MRSVSRVRLERLVDCPFSEAQEVAEDVLRSGEDRDDAHRRFVFGCHPDEAEPGRLHDAVDVDWRYPSFRLPRFRGTVRLRIASVTRTRIVLEGSYRPPFGIPGRLFDAVLGRRLACRALRGLLDSLCDAMETRERVRVRVLSGSAV